MTFNFLRGGAAMPGTARGGTSCLQLGAGGGALVPAAAGSPGGGLVEESLALHARAHLQTAGGHEAGPVAVCADFGE